MRLLTLCRASFFSSLVAAGAIAASPPQPSALAPGQLGAAATENESATRAALQVLRAGGHAVDAAIAATLVLGVVNPTSSGLGGGGFALVWDNVQHTLTALDFRETAPQQIDPHSLDRRPVPDAQRGVLAGVPGEIAGLLELHRRWGTRLFALDVAPAVVLAEQGFPLSPHMARALRDGESWVRVSPGLGALFYTLTGPLTTGQTARNPTLGQTLRLIASGGKPAFYAGPIAADIVSAVRAHGGKMTESDLANYAPIERTPLQVAWEGYQVYTMPPPSAGGLLLAETLKMHSRSELRTLGDGTAESIHLLAETFRGAVADRMTFVGDPSRVSVPLERLLSDEHLRARKAKIARDRTTPPTRFAQPEHGTAHLVVVDQKGNVVSLTTTVNDSFGSRILAPKSGVVLNDQLDDFTSPDTAAEFGQADGGPNRPRPGARPVSSMTPTIVVRDSKPVLALGGSGGMRIPTNVTEVLLRILAFDRSPADVAQAPRFFVSMNSSALLHEQPWPADPVVKDLRARGEQVDTTSFPAAVTLIALDASGKVDPQADPRKFGVAAVLQGP